MDRADGNPTKMLLELFVIICFLILPCAKSQGLFFEHLVLLEGLGTQRVCIFFYRVNSSAALTADMEG